MPLSRCSRAISCCFSRARALSLSRSLPLSLFPSFSSPQLSLSVSLTAPLSSVQAGAARARHPTRSAPTTPFRAGTTLYDAIIVSSLGHAVLYAATVLPIALGHMRTDTSYDARPYSVLTLAMLLPGPLPHSEPRHQRLRALP
eukprot:1646293-Rhodomonas_salina.1